MNPGGAKEDRLRYPSYRSYKSYRSCPVIFAAAADVIAVANRARPADAVLRAELRRRSGLSRAEAGEISRAVFAYYRWLGWLDPKQPATRQIQHALELQARFEKNPASFSAAELRRAIPEWVTDEMDTREDWLRALQQTPALWLRARPGQGSALAEKLDGARTSAAWPDALIYEGREDLFRTPEFHAGEFELQDVGSQIVGLACAPRPGETWWDACAGEGGKMLHLCDLMANRGLVWASDRAEWRLDKLKRRAARARLFNYRCAVWDGAEKLPTKTKFDGVLVDAPCSGLGTWQRNPHARWTTRPEDAAELAEVQKRLLERAAAGLKPGGRLIYAVCTLTRRETTEVAKFADRLPGLVPSVLNAVPRKPGPHANRVFLWPQDTGGNGMFIAAWEKPRAV